MSVLADVLEALADEPSPLLTNVATRTNVPYDRLLAYVHELRRLRLISEDEARPRPTRAGMQLLAQRQRWTTALHDAGIDEPRQD